MSIIRASVNDIKALITLIKDRYGNVDNTADANKNVATAKKWTTARNINGMSIDGSENSTNYGTCSTAAATAAKTVSCTGFALVTGAEITVKFTVTNSAANPTLNVNNTGAKAIYYRGAAISAAYLAANRTYTFRYNGTQYELVGDIDTNTQSTVDSTLSSTSTNPVQNKVIYTALEGKAEEGHTHNYAGSSSAGGAANSAVKLQTARDINGVAFDGTKDITIIANPITTQLTDESLNDIQTPGLYYGAGSNNVTNKPSGVDAFGLHVYITASGYYAQELTEYDTDKKWIRHYGNDAWSGWYSFYTTNNPPSAANASASGFMSAADKTKLDGIDTGANKYTHPSYTAKSNGLYKITVDATGHVSEATEVVKSDITALGIPSTNTTYSAMEGASESEAGSEGLVPAPTAGAQDKFLRGDGTWQTPINTTYSNMTGATTEVAGTSGLVPAPSAGAATRYLRSDGAWATPPDTNTTYSDMKGATSTAAGSSGLVPAPAGGDQSKFLRGDGTWQVPTNTDTKVTQTNTTTNADYRVLLSLNANDTTETDGARKSAKFLANPSTGQFTATTFNGDLSGNASTATKLETERTITLSGDATGSTTFDGTDDKTITVTINKLKQRQVTIPSSGWSTSYPYTNTVSVSGLSADSDLKIVGVYLETDATEDEVKAANKAAGYLIYNESGVADGAITFKAYKKPTVNFTVITEGG